MDLWRRCREVLVLCLVVELERPATEFTQLGGANLRGYGHAQVGAPLLSRCVHRHFFDTRYRADALGVGVERTQGRGRSGFDLGAASNGGGKQQRGSECDDSSHPLPSPAVL